MGMLSIKHLTYRIGHRPIFENASATIMRGWKVGVVGPNGAGKSTLFKLATDHLLPDGGEIEIQDGINVGYITQDLPDENMKILDVVLDADKKRKALLQEIDENPDPYKLADIHEQLNLMDAHSAPARAASILNGLGFSEASLQEPLKSLSGGWRMRVALASALFQQPDLLLLDEPTNHLDLEGIMWLENYLQTYPYTLVVISHDRQLLNKCTDHILHVENKTLEAYTGNYDDFERERAEKRGQQQKLYEKQQAYKERMEKFISRFRAKASKARQAQSRIKALERMNEVNAVIADRSVQFTFPQPTELSPPLLTLNGADIGYNKTPVLEDVSLRLDMDDKIALLGANGNGKSTLIKAIGDKLDLLDGTRQASGKLRIGYFAQHQADELNLENTPFEEMTILARGDSESGVRGKLGQFGFNKTLQDTPIGSLSGGEKARLLFALMTFDAPQLLLLDEPTNHLDIDAREALVQALNDYEGAVVMVSHDPDMVERVADRLLLVADGGVRAFNGDLSDYREHILEATRALKAEGKNKSRNKKQADNLTPKERRQQKAAERKAIAHLRKDVEKAEKLLEKLQGKKADMEAEMADPDYYDDMEAVQDSQFKYGKLLKDIDAAEADWLAAQEKYETAKAESA